MKAGKYQEAEIEDEIQLFIMHKCYSDHFFAQHTESHPRSQLPDIYMLSSQFHMCRSF